MSRLFVNYALSATQCSECGRLGEIPRGDLVNPHAVIDLLQRRERKHVCRAKRLEVPEAVITADRLLREAGFA